MIFSIVICSYNSDINLLDKVIISCQKNIDRVGGEIILVSNGSQLLPLDDFQNYFSKKVDQFYHLEFGSLEKARIEGVTNAKGDFIVFVDDDNILDSKYLIEAYTLTQKKTNQRPLIVGGLNYLSREHYKSDRNISHNMLNYLACESGFKKSGGEEITSSVFGAGMIVSKNDLLNLYEIVRLQCTGRSSGHLLSGDDTEICFYLSFKNATIIKSNNLVLKHEIPNERLEKNYIVKLSLKMLITLPYLHFIYWRKSYPKFLAILLSFFSSILILFRWVVILRDINFIFKGFYNLFKGNIFLAKRLKLVEKNILNYANS